MPGARVTGTNVAAAVTDVTDATFHSAVLGSDLPVLVEYWAPWCGPCRMVGPVVEELATELAGRLRVVRMDTDANPVTAANQRIMGVPTMTLFRAGAAVASVVGARPKAALRGAFEPFLD